MREAREAQAAGGSLHLAGRRAEHERRKRRGGRRPSRWPTTAARIRPSS